MPDFIIGGAMRAGTTSLWAYVQQHPLVCMADVKEPFFFADETGAVLDPTDPLGQTGNFSAGWSWYRALFSACPDNARLGEGTARYLHTPSSAQLIGREAPDAKLIFVLRDPAERAYSHYWLQRQGRDLRPFDELAADDDPLFVRYVDIGRYAGHLERFFEYVERERVLVLLFDDLRADPRGTVDRALRFLAVDPGDLVALDAAPRNVTVTARSGLAERTLQRLELLDTRIRVPEGVKRLARAARRRVRQANLRPVSPPTLSSVTRRKIVEALGDDMVRLEAMLGRDLAAWRS